MFHWLASRPLVADALRILAFANGNGEGAGNGEGGAAPDGEAAQDGDGGSIWTMLLPFLAIAVLWYFLLMRPQRRQQAEKEQMLKSLKKNDKIVTIGGIMGTVVSVSQDGKEVTVKVDDNTRLKMVQGSIQTVIRDEADSKVDDKDKAKE